MGVAASAMLAITVLAQRPWRVRGVAWLKQRDHFALIPSWTFFAPRPGVEDTRLLWRERTTDGGVGLWRELVPPETSALRMAWNPTKRVRKAITDIGPALARRAARDPRDKRILLSVPYLAILNHVASLPRSPMSEARQFLVARTQGEDDGDDEPRIILASHWHPLDERAPDAATSREPAAVEVPFA